MHCLDPACVSVCPVAALQKSEAGPVTYDEDRCMGCRYCMVACPFGVPKYEWDKVLPRVQKCVMCASTRLAEGRTPACTDACPAGATVFGERDALLAEARSRIRSKPDVYVDRIFGLEEAGGTSVIYLSAVPFEKLGFPVTLEKDAYPKLTWNILSKIPNIVTTGGALMLGIWWIANRRESVRQYEEDVRGEGGPK
jgi:formate dehydrogenase iron-sulfur subunit